jgi:transposase
MAMGHKQPTVSPGEALPQGQGHPFYQKLESILTQQGFDGFVEQRCRKFYARKMGRPSLPPGLYFRILLMGYFEGLGSERAMAWRLQDSLSLRAWLGFGPTDPVPVHATLGNTRRRLSVRAHRDVFRWVLARLGEAGLLCGRTVGIDASTIEANAALKSLRRRDSGKDYQQFLDELLKAAGVDQPTAQDRRRMDRKRKKKLSNKEWFNPHDPQARITKLKDGRTHLGYKDEQVVDLDTGAVVAVLVHPADRGDPQSLPGSLQQAEQNLVSLREGEAAKDPESHVEEAVGDKGYHSNQALLHCEDRGIRTYFSEPQRGQRKWKGNQAARRAVYRNRRRIRQKRGKRLLRRRGELLERPFAHRLDLGGMRRAHVRGQANVQKREYIAASAQNLGLLMRHRHRVGTPRSLQDLRAWHRRLHQAQPCTAAAQHQSHPRAKLRLRDPPPQPARSDAA